MTGRRGSSGILAAAAAAALAFGTGGSALAAGSGGDPADRCLQIADAARRLDCFESVQRARHEAAPPAAAAPRAQAPQARRSFGLPTPRLPRRREAVEGEDQVTVRLAEVGRTHDRMLWFRTTDGAVWSQDDPTIVEIAPSVDAKVKIRRSVMGGYFCDMTRWQSVRCRRVELPPQ